MCMPTRLTFMSLVPLVFETSALAGICKFESWDYLTKASAIHFDCIEQINQKAHKRNWVLEGDYLEQFQKCARFNTASLLAKTCGRWSAIYDCSQSYRPSIASHEPELVKRFYLNIATKCAKAEIK